MAGINKRKPYTTSSVQLPMQLQHVHWLWTGKHKRHGVSTHPCPCSCPLTRAPVCLSCAVPSGVDGRVSLVIMPTSTRWLPHGTTQDGGCMWPPSCIVGVLLHNGLHSRKKLMLLHTLLHTMQLPAHAQLSAAGVLVLWSRCKHTARGGRVPSCF